MRKSLKAERLSVSAPPTSFSQLILSFVICFSILRAAGVSWPERRSRTNQLGWRERALRCSARLKQQSRRQHGANGFAFVPIQCPRHVGLSANRGSSLAVFDKANLFPWHDFFTAVKCKVDITARGADKKAPRSGKQRSFERRLRGAGGLGASPSDSNNLPGCLSFPN